MKPEEAQAQIAATVEKQKAEDAVGMQAASATLPGPLRDIWSPTPDIPVGNGKYSVRRFVDGDFIALASMGHPLNGIQSIADKNIGYKFVPTGKDCWLLCWLMTRPRKESKAFLKSAGIEGIEEAASDEFGDFKIFQLEELMVAILKQINIYGSAHVEYEAKKEGEGSENPPQPSSPQSATV